MRRVASRTKLRGRAILRAVLPVSAAIAVAVAVGVAPAASAPVSAPAPTVTTAPAAERSPGGPEFFAAPDGSPAGDGSEAKPWDLQTALDQPDRVVPGSTIWLKGGTYVRRDDRTIRSHYLNFRSKLTGRPGSPIMVRPYRNERVILSGGARNVGTVLGISGAHAWYWDLEVTTIDPIRRSSKGSSNPEEPGAGGGIASNAPFVKLIHCIVHDNAVGVGLGSAGGGTEAYGVLSYYNGWLAPDRPHGHGFYVQNDPGAPQSIRDCVIFRNLEYGAQSFGVRARLDDIVLEGSTIFNGGGFDARGFQGGYLVGGGIGAERAVVRNNDFYFPGETGQSLNVGYEAYGPGPEGQRPVATDAVVTGNYFAGGHLYFHRGNVRPTYAGNTFYSGPVNDQPLAGKNAFRESFPDNLYIPYPGRLSGKIVHVRPSVYEPGRGTLTVFNWDRSPTVSVDLRAIVRPGASWRVVNAQDYYGREVAGGPSFDGSPVLLPMTALTQAAPVGLPPPAASGPEFNVFIVLTADAPPRTPGPAEPPSPPRPSPRAAVR